MRGSIDRPTTWATNRSGVRRKPFGRAYPVLFGRFHLFAQAAGRGAQAVKRQVGDEPADSERLDVLVIETVEHARKGIHRYLAPLGYA